MKRQASGAMQETSWTPILTPYSRSPIKEEDDPLVGICNNNRNHNSIMANAILLSESLLLSCSESSFITAPMALLHQSLSDWGVEEQYFPTPRLLVQFLVLVTALALLTILCCCWRSYYQRPKNRHKSRKELNIELEMARAKVRLLEEKLVELNNSIKLADHKGDKEIRIFMDGAFDLLHYGHMNAFRLARSLGTHLIVGVNSDESITRCKGAPLMTDSERLTMVKTCKFVDEVVEDCPYVMSPEYLEWVIREYRIDYVVHGSDPCFTLDGQDVYASAKARGKFREIPRTEGVSTSDILGRILVMTREHHIYDRKQIKSDAEKGGDQSNLMAEDGQQFQLKSKFLTTSLLLKLFSAGVKAPQKDAKLFTLMEHGTFFILAM